MNVSDIVILLTLAFFFLVFVIFIEAVILSKGLTKKWLQENILFKVVLSNLMSAVGVVVFFNWVWDFIYEFLRKNLKWHDIREIQELNPLPPHESVQVMLIFLLTLLLEIPINIFLLKSHFQKKRIVIYTIYATIVPYILLAILLMLMMFSSLL